MLMLCVTILGIFYAHEGQGWVEGRHCINKEQPQRAHRVRVGGHAASRSTRRSSGPAHLYSWQSASTGSPVSQTWPVSKTQHVTNKVAQNTQAETKTKNASERI